MISTYFIAVSRLLDFSLAVVVACGACSPTATRAPVDHAVEAVAPGPTPLVPDAGPADAPPTAIAPDLIRESIMARLPRVRICYESALARLGKVKGNVTIQWTIAPSGVVERSDVVTNTFGDERLGRCIADVVVDAIYPASSTSATASWGFRLKPPD